MPDKKITEVRPHTIAANLPFTRVPTCEHDAGSGDDFRCPACKTDLRAGDIVGPTEEFKSQFPQRRHGGWDISGVIVRRMRKDEDLFTVARDDREAEQIIHRKFIQLKSR